MPKDLIFKTLNGRWMQASFGFACAGRSRLCRFTGEFSRNLLADTRWALPSLIDDMITKVVHNSGVVKVCDPKIVDAITAGSGIIQKRDGNLIKVLLSESGLMKRFDNYIVNSVIEKCKFYPRFEHLLVNRYIRKKRHIIKTNIFFQICPHIASMRAQRGTNCLRTKRLILIMKEFNYGGNVS